MSDSPSLLTRRRALVGAAWSAPAIVVASAVPAFAASPSSSLVLRDVASGAEASGAAPNRFYDLRFTGLSVIVPSAVPAGGLTLTVTFTPAAGLTASTMLVLDDPAQVAPAGFTITPGVGETATSVLLTYAPAVAAGGVEVQVPNGTFVGANESTATQRGTYVVTARAPGLTSAAISFATPTTARTAPGTTIVRRSVV